MALAAGRTVVRIDGPVLAEPDATAPTRLPDGWRITPGLVDLQINGMGDAFPLADPASIPRLDEMAAGAGVTSWLLAIPSAAPEAVADVAAAAEAFTAAGVTGLAGLHLEGPVLSPSFAGAHPVEHLRDGTDPAALALLDLPGVRMVTIAPEVPGAMTFAHEAMARGITVAAGHTGATFEQACAAIDEGITLCTHLFNAMTPVHHRAPGAAMAYLTDPRARVAFIADGEHLHASIEDLIVATAGERAMLVSDAAPDAGAVAGREPPGGVLVGSRGSLADAVARLAPRISPERAIALATTAPARVLGAPASLAPGTPADLTIWDDDGRVAGCIRRGEVAFASTPLRVLL